MNSVVKVCCRKMSNHIRERYRSSIDKWGAQLKNDKMGNSKSYNLRIIGY